MKQENRISVAFVEDNEEVYEFLFNLFDKAEGIECVASYRNAEDAVLFMPKKTDIDVAIIDIGLPDMNGIECLERLIKEMPKTEFAMYTIFEANDTIFESLKVGATGYLLKKTKPDQLLEAIKELKNGGSPMSPSIARKVTDYFFSGKKTTENKRISILTTREKNLLAELAKGLLYKEIALELGITTGTVKQHINKIYKKLEVQNRTEAANLFFDRK